MTNESVWAVVPAAGIGSRMQADRPKQYLELDGRLVLEHTLERLASHSNIHNIVVAIAPEDSWWPQVTLPTGAHIHIVVGGVQRADSVLNALLEVDKKATDNPWVLVHDAARPCLRIEDIDHMFEELSQHAVGGILGIPVNDTVKRANAEGTIIGTVEREWLWRASTPQMFRLQQLKKALQTAKLQNLAVTDEASAIEFAGFHPMMVEGHADNIKITVPQDLALASQFIKQQENTN